MRENKRMHNGGGWVGPEPILCHFGPIRVSVCHVVAVAALSAKDRIRRRAARARELLIHCVFERVDEDGVLATLPGDAACVVLPYDKFIEVVEARLNQVLVEVETLQRQLNERARSRLRKRVSLVEGLRWQ